ncbi:MAG: flagellar filament outer layer protein FlaA [Treponema sp.]|nr:flagellar filament outer layer protein FlaA [Treponema sp.]
MKQGSFRAIRLIAFLFVMLSLTVFSVSAQQPTVNLQSIIIDTFDGETTRQWTIGGRTFTHEFEWRADASRFASTIDGEAFPQLSFIPAWPMALFGANRDNRDIRSLGIWGRFDRRGYNWIDIYPVVAGSGDDGENPQAFEIPIPGRIRYLDMWVWGSNLNYFMEVFFRDHRGIVHTIPMGSLAFQGWQNMRVRIPTHIPQSRTVLPRVSGLNFVKFRIWTTPTERVDNFFIYFNQLQILTDIFETLFDGNDLADPERVQELWGQAQAQ